MEIIRPLEPGRAAHLLDWSSNGHHRTEQPAEHVADQELLERLMLGVKEGSTRALQRLMDELWPGLIRFAARELGDRDLAEDLVQEAFVYLWRHRSAWVPRGSPRAYVFRIVRNRIVDERRKNEVRRRWAHSHGRTAGSAPATADQAMGCSEITQAFNEAVAALPERRREAFSLVFMRALSHEEAAYVMGTSKQTVSNQVAAALKEVRAAVGRVADDV